MAAQPGEKTLPPEPETLGARMLPRTASGPNLPVRNLIQDRTIHAASGEQIEHGGIYCETTVRVDEHDKFSVDGHRTREAHFVVHLGIIDMLQSYGGKKQAEALAKSMCWDQAAVSVSPPNFYGRRFRFYMNEHVFQPDHSVCERVDLLPGAEQGGTLDFSDDISDEDATPTPKQNQLSPPSLQEKKRREIWIRQHKRMLQSQKLRALTSRKPAQFNNSAMRSAFMGIHHSSLDDHMPITRNRRRLKHWTVKEINGILSPCFKNVPAQELAYNVALGVHHLIDKCSGHPNQVSMDFPSRGIPLDDPDYPDFPEGIDKTGVPDFTFKIYRPQTFRELRRVYGIDDSSFRNSLSMIRPIGNPGASGSQLFMSSDDAYIIKTLETTEYDFLIGQNQREGILEEYAKYLGDDKESLLPKFLAVLGVKTILRRKIRLVVMQNVLPKTVLGVKPSLKFDLKGSTLGRMASTSERQKGSSTTWKDLDFEKLFPAHKIGYGSVEETTEGDPEKLGGLRLKQKEYDTLAKRLKKDAKILAALGIIDHSLLLGCYEIPKENISSTSSGALVTRWDDTLESELE